MKAPETCPVCGAAVPPKAKACPECGADERSGWNEDDSIYDGLDLPGEDDGLERLKQEKRTGNTVILIVAIALILAVLLVFIL